MKQLKYESLNYGPYENLKKIFLSVDFEPEDVEELDLSNERAPSFPNKYCFLYNSFKALFRNVEKFKCASIIPQQNN